MPTGAGERTAGHRRTPRAPPRGLGSLHKQIAPPAVLAAGQAYLLHSLRADGSFDGNILLTAVAFRALALTQYPVSGFSGATMQYFTTTQGGDGSYGGGDAYVTAPVLETLYSNKANLIIKPGDFSPLPSATNSAT